jgi:hypothetical protein
MMRKIGTKGAVPEQIPVNFILILAMFALGAAIMLLMIGRWLDITGVKYKFETQRNTMNLLQLLVTNSPVVKRDSTGTPLKLVLDEEKLTEYNNFASIGMGNVVPWSDRDVWERCCDFLDFDYNFTVHNVMTGENFTIGNLIYNQLSSCYPQRVVGVSDLPIVIDDVGRNDAGIATVKMIRTPLSELSFWLSQAFIRASWEKYWSVYSKEAEYYVKIPLDPEINCVEFIDFNGDSIIDINDCVNNYGRVCVILKDGRESCKMFVCDNSVTFTTDWNHPNIGTCFGVLITSEKGSVKIFYPGVCT